MMEEEILEKIYPIYEKAIKRFPEIKEEIKIRYYPLEKNIGLIVFYKSDLTGRITATPTLFIGPFFLALWNDKEREIQIAHEIGHYIHKRKHLNPVRLERQMKWRAQLKIYNREPDYFEEHRIRRLKKWNRMYELLADRHVVEAGYSIKAVLELNTKAYKLPLTKTSKEELSIRIKNLEKLLEKE